jgi:hypothetical protein
MDLTDGSITTINGDDIRVDLRSSGNIVLNDNTIVVGRDYDASNGVIQEINKVLNLPADPPPTPPPAPAPTPNPSIIDVLEGRGNFQTLLAALEATGLASFVSSVTD